MTPRTRSQTRSSRKRNISDDSMYSETTASDVDNSDSDAESVVERVPKTRRVSRAQYIEQESDQDTDMEDFSTEDEEQEVDASSGAMKEDDATEEGSETSEKADDDEEEEGEDEYFTPDESEEYNDGEEDEEYGDLPEGRRRQLGYDARRSKAKHTYECTYPDCGRVYSYPFSLYAHQRNEHPFELSCKECDERFPTRERVKEHVNLKHKPSYRFQCNVCHSKFKTQKNLKNHRRYVNCKKK
ncbi:hypothetical protein VTP01DRAFT_3147 [Rhizomucor pusillus]|uniref:uncharacterized protein n=1 Tax=Rhizomucor pusillus TaxID=4840 RepID=UPI003743F72B